MQPSPVLFFFSESVSPSRDTKVFPMTSTPGSPLGILLLPNTFFLTYFLDFVLFSVLLFLLLLLDFFNSKDYIMDFFKL